MMQNIIQFTVINITFKFLQYILKMRNLNEYKILGLQPGASYVEIRRAYKQLAKKSHPDKIKNHQQDQNLDFKKIKEAYEALKESEVYLKKNKKLITKFSNIFSLTKSLTYDQIRELSNFLETSQSSDSEDENFFICQAIKVTNLKEMTKKLIQKKRQPYFYSLENNQTNGISFNIEKFKKIKQDLFSDDSNSSQMEEQSNIEFQQQQQSKAQQYREQRPTQAEIHRKIQKKSQIFQIFK